MQTCHARKRSLAAAGGPAACALKTNIRLLLLPSVLFMHSVLAAPPDHVIASMDQSLTIDQAITIALENNLSLRTARTRIRQQEGALTHASRAFPGNPELELKGGYRARPGSDTVDIGIRIAQEIWLGGQGDLMRSAAENRLTAARADYAYLQTATAARARRAFLNVLWARESMETAHRTLRFARELEGYARQRLEVGEATRLDLNTAQLGTARAHNALQKAEATLERARIQLTRVLSINVAELPAIEGELDLRPLQLPAQDALVNRAARRRQDLRSAARRIMAARKDLELSRRQVIPNLTVFGFIEREGGDNYIPGIGVSLPLPILHQYEGEIEQASATLERQLLEQDELFLQIRHELALATTDYRSARERVRIVSNRMLKAAENNVALVQEAFRAGEVGASELATAQNNLLDVRDEYLQALRDLITAGVELERVTAGVVTLAGVNKSSEKTVTEAANND